MRRMRVHSSGRRETSGCRHGPRTHVSEEWLLTMSRCGRNVDQQDSLDPLRDASSPNDLVYPAMLHARMLFFSAKPPRFSLFPLCSCSQPLHIEVYAVLLDYRIFDSALLALRMFVPTPGSHRCRLVCPEGSHIYSSFVSQQETSGLCLRDVIRHRTYPDTIRPCMLPSQTTQLLAISP